MKKIIPFIIVLQLVFCNIVVFGQTAAVGGWVVEDFESSDISHITAVNAKLSRTSMLTLGNSKGALDVSVIKDSGAPSFQMEQKAGVTYEISCYIKVKETLLKDQVQFVFQAPAAGATTKRAYNIVTVANAGLKAGQWAHITARYVCDGMGKLVGVTERVPVLEDGTVDIRMGDGKIAGTSPNGSTVDYYLEDLTVLPALAAADGNLVVDGDFESPAALTSWTKSGAASVSLVKAGANGSAQCVYVAGQSNLSNLSQKAPVKFNTGYKITFWAKTSDPATNGAELQMIFDRKSSKTDSNIKSYQYLKDQNHPTVGTEWTKYEIDYRYDIVTDDEKAYPSVYLRIGDGTASAVKFYLDEISIVETGGGAEQPAVDITLDGACKAGEQLNANIAYHGNDGLMGYIVTVQRQTEDGLAYVSNGQVTNGRFSYTVAEADKGAVLRFRAMAVNSEGKLTASGETVSAKITADRRIQTGFANMVWTAADASLEATVQISNDDTELQVMAAVALYDENGVLTEIEAKTETIGPDAVWRAALPVENIGTAELAKIFVFEAQSLTPLTAVNAISKRKDAACIFVDAQNGSDLAPGTQDAPFATLEKAKSAAAELAADSDVYVMLRGGTYTLEKTLSFTPGDLDAQHNITFTAYGTERAVISGARQAENWELFDEEKNIYRSCIGKDTNFRQLYINGVRGVRARSESGLTGGVQTAAGYTCTDMALADYAYPQDLEMVYYVKWTNPRCAVSSITPAGNTVQINMHPTGWSKIRDKGMSSVTKDYLPAYYENAYELLDAEGEWYMNTHDGYVYYKPRFFENIRTAEVEYPVLEKLVSVRGTADNNAANLEFKNIAFQHSTWMKPTEQGYLADMQNNHQSGVTGALPEAALELSYVDHISFTGCSFSKLGVTAMKLTEGVKNCNIVGNAFYDLSGSAVSLGVPSGDYNKYINPADERYAVRNNRITDNYIHTTGVDYKSAAALSAAFPKDTLIANNEIFDSPYSGMHLGYGWNTYAENGTATENFTVEHNYIHNVMNDRVYDGGAIYTMGKTSGTAQNYNQIRANYIRDVKNHYGALYPDEGSQYWEFSENVMDLSSYPYYYGAGGGSGTPAKWLHLWTSSITNNKLTDNYATTDYCTNAGVNNIFEKPTVCDAANWPQAAQAVIDAAGVREPYAARLQIGLQDVDALTQYAAQVGDDVVLSVSATTGKGQKYDYRYSTIYIESSNPEVIEIGKDFRGKALAKGESLVRVAILEKGILQSFEMEICVE